MARAPTSMNRLELSANLVSTPGDECEELAIDAPKLLRFVRGDRLALAQLPGKRGELCRALLYQPADVRVGVAVNGFH